MGTLIRPVHIADFDVIHRSLLTSLDPRIPRNRWRALFDWGWPNPEDHVGYGLFDEHDRPLGYIATIYSKQNLRGEHHTVCNFSSWIVAEGHKSAGLSLIMPVLARRDLTITNLTAIPSVVAMFRKLGFQTLETLVWVLGPGNLPMGIGSRGIKVRRVNSQGDLPDSSGAHRIFLDHREICQHWVLETGGDSCYVASTLGRRRRLRTLRIHHLSHPELFAAGATAFQRQGLASCGAPFVECDLRLLQGVDPGVGRSLPLLEPRLFRSTVADPASISNLYSELPLLRL